MNGALKRRGPSPLFFAVPAIRGSLSCFLMESGAGSVMCSSSQGQRFTTWKRTDRLIGESDLT